MKKCLIGIVGCEEYRKTRFEWMKKYSLDYLDNNLFDIKYFIGNSDLKKDWIEDGEIVYVRSGDKWRNLIDKYTLVLNYSYYSEYAYTWYSDDDVFLCWKHFNNFNEIFSVKIDLYCTTGVNIYSPMKYFNVYGLSKVRQVDREKKIPLVNYNTKNPHIVANNVSRTEMFFLTGGGALMKRRFLKFMIESLAKQQSKLDYINENIDDGNGFADAYISHCFNKNLPYRKENYTLEGKKFILGENVLDNFEDNVISYHSAYLSSEETFKKVAIDYEQSLNKV